MSTELPFVPVNTPDLSGREEEYVVSCIRSGWISSEGPFVEQFELEMAARVGRRFGIAVANGSVALDLAVAALRLSPGDEVVMPTFTIISCAAAIVRAGAVPVLVDADSATWNMNVDAVASRITPRTRAIMIVHLYGLPVDIGPILELADLHGLAVIEDAAEVIGQTWNERPCGSFGALSTFSFYPNKQVTTGEGGMVVTDDSELAERCRSLRNLAFQPGRRFVHEELGWNYRLSNLQAAVGVAQLERLDQILTRKREIGQLYTNLLQDISEIVLPLARTEYAESVYWFYGLVLNDDVPFDSYGAIHGLAKRGIGTRPFFWPMHEQPVFRQMGLFQGERYPVAERIARRGFYLPSGLGLSDDDLKRSADAVRSLLHGDAFVEITA